MSSSEIERLVDAFENAVIGMEGLGAIPVFSDDPDEMRAVTAERRRIKANYTRAKNRLLEALAV